MLSIILPVSLAKATEDSTGSVIDYQDVLDYKIVMCYDYSFTKCVSNGDLTIYNLEYIEKLLRIQGYSRYKIVFVNDMYKLVYYRKAEVQDNGK